MGNSMLYSKLTASFPDASAQHTRTKCQLSSEQARMAIQRPNVLLNTHLKLVLDNLEPAKLSNYSFQ